MQTDTNYYYKATGSAPLGGKLIAYGVGLVLSTVLSIAYIFLVNIMLIPYILIFIAILYAVVLGYSAKIVAKIGLLRNKKERLLFGLYMGVIAYYVQWVVYIAYLIHGFTGTLQLSVLMDVFLNPADLIHTIGIVNQEGAWSIGDAVVNGWPLTIIWIFEAGLVLGIPPLIINFHPLPPYSENLNKWYRKYVLQQFFEYIVTQNGFIEQLRETGGQALHDLDKGMPNRFGRASIFFLSDEEVAYLSFENVFLENSGRGSEKSTSIVHLFKIDKTTAQELMEKYRTKKSFFLDY